ncbi:hypothetical protein Cni_G18627 [Canna indica]|uniref:Uncharacterized protein n=1 Tax=Canna indica TaxID=4628 RepID=A0AAQ3KJS4_9LILI|nr:hypothetical protein Cni_G18627 [Canna indica]
MKIILLVVCGLLTIFFKTSEGRQLERSSSDFNLQGAKGKENLPLDNNFAFSSNDIGGKSNEENKIDVNNHKNKANVVGDPSSAHLFEDTKTSNDGRIRNTRVMHKNTAIVAGDSSLAHIFDQEAKVDEGKIRNTRVNHKNTATLDSSLAHIFEDEKASDGGKIRNRPKNKVNFMATAMDSHHQITIDEYRRMSHNAPKPHNP